MKNSVWKTFMELSLVRGIVPRTVFGLTAIAAIILIIGLALSKSKKRGRLHPLIVSLIAAVLAGAAGLLVAWLVSDVFMVFGVSLGWPVIFTIAGGIAGVGFVIAAAVTLRGVRRALAVVLVPLVCCPPRSAWTRFTANTRPSAPSSATRRTPRSAQSRYTRPR